MINKRKMVYLMEEIIAHVIQPINWLDVVISACSLIISVVAVVISVNTYHSQKEYNSNSVRPILDIIFGDYENNLHVSIDNHGVGPAIVNDVICTRKKGDRIENEKCLVDLIPTQMDIKTGHGIREIDLGVLTDFVEDIRGRAIPPGGRVVLLQKKDPDEDQLYALRCVLKDCSLEIDYTDIYGEKAWETKRNLDFFGRTIIREVDLVEWN